MFFYSHFKQSGRTASLLLCGLLIAIHVPAHGQSAEKEDSGPKLRIVCVSSLSEEHEVVLASRDEKGAWLEYGTVKLRSPLITEWLPAKPGELHLAQRSTNELVSICRFTYPADTRRALLVLLPQNERKSYLADVINPDKLKFAQGSTLLVNYSSTSASIMLGTRRANMKPGERAVVKPEPESNGMFRMLVGFAGKSDEPVVCYDRYVPYSNESRDMLMLFPDPVLGLRVFSLAEFGPYE
jgi:hypothetical protein